ncbi:MarR family transcriptional regulator [Demequina pelophila]|uniref:MarR family transcriptional regulator n=1 Tax=Demequina pelophila TaxID=1638984 RepID=UPI000780F9B6|nr:MarR family transcriptional regulator [Demequina pelophila]
MRNDVPAVAPFLRSDSQARILAETLLREGEHTVGEIAARTGIPRPTVSREVARLAAAGILTSRKVGPARLVAANPDYPLAAPLAQIIAATYGPAALVHDAFADLPGLEHLIVFGSWAARLAGQPGRFPGDVDILIVGDVSKMDAYGIADDLGRTIGRPVNVTVMSADRWNGDGDGFVLDIKGNPTMVLA